MKSLIILPPASPAGGNSLRKSFIIQSLLAFRLAKIRSYEGWMIGGPEEWKSLGGLEDGKDCNIGRPCLAMFGGSERDEKSTKLARNRLRGATID